MPLFFSILLCCFVMVYCEEPLWFINLPKSLHKDYYYRAAQATGRTEKLAIDNAIEKARFESAYAVGIQKLEEYNMPFNKVCENVRFHINDGGYKAYILIQVAYIANPSPIWNKFDCKLNSEITKVE